MRLQKHFIFDFKIDQNSHVFRDASWNLNFSIFNFKNLNFRLQHGIQLEVKNLSFFYNFASGTKKASGNPPRRPRASPERLQDPSSLSKTSPRALFFKLKWTSGGRNSSFSKLNTEKYCQWASGIRKSSVLNGNPENPKILISGIRKSLFLSLSYENLKN